MLRPARLRPGGAQSCPGVGGAAGTLSRTPDRAVCTALHTSAGPGEAPVKICTDVTMSPVSAGQNHVL